METKELMTNDFVLYRGNPLRIFETDDFSEFVNKETEGFVGYFGETNIHISELLPIPLTDGFLKKNFEMYNDRYYLGGSWKLQKYGEGKYEIGIVIDAYDDVVVSEVIRRKLTDSDEILEDLSDDTIINEVIRRKIADSDEIVGYLVHLGYFKEKE